MRSGVDGWRAILATGYVGLYVLPMAAFTFDSMSMLRSLGPAMDGPDGGGAGVGVVLISAWFAVTLLVAVPGLALSLYADASRIDGPAWAPDAARYGLLGALYPVSLLVAGWYLYRRLTHVGLGHFPLHEPLPARALADAGWWYGVAVGPPLVLVGLALFVAPYWAVLGYPWSLFVRANVMAVVAGTGAAFFYLGLGADLSYVRAGEVAWQPGRRRYELVCLLLPVAAPLVAVVYLVQRHRHVGVP